MVQPSTKIDEPSTSALIVESDDENEEQGSLQTEPIPPNPPTPKNSSKPSST